MDSGLEDRLETGARALGLSLAPALSKDLRRLADLVRRWSGRVRLVGRTDDETMAVRHLLDSLTVRPFLEGLPAGARVLDIGSGAGFPGLPLALARRDLEVHLVEVDRRKAAFLKAAVAELGLSVRVHTVRAEGRPEGEGVPRGEVVVSRAFTAPEAWVPLGARYLAAGGCLLATLGAQVPERARLEALGAGVGLTLERVWEGELPGGAGHRAIVAWRQGGAPAR